LPAPPGAHPIEQKHPFFSLFTMRAISQRPLAKGQVWKTRAADIEIVALGKRHIHYKVTQQLGRRHVSVQISGIDAMANYLQANAARLVKGASAN
jgi:hypothetical protein